MSSASSTNTERSNEFWPTTHTLINLPIDPTDKTTSPSTSTFPTRIPNQVLYQSKPRNFSLPLSKAESNISSSPPSLFAPDLTAIASASFLVGQAPKREEPLDGFRKFFRKRSMSFGLKKGGPGSKYRPEGELASRVSTTSDETVPSVPSTPKLLLPLGQSTMKTNGMDRQIVESEQTRLAIGKEAYTLDRISRANSRRIAQDSLVVSTALNETLSTFSFPPPNATFSGPSIVDPLLDEPVSPRTIVRPQFATAPGPRSISQTPRIPSSESALLIRKEPESIKTQSSAPTSPSSSSFIGKSDDETHVNQTEKLVWLPSERIDQIESPSSYGKEHAEEDDDKDESSDQTPDRSSMIDFDFVLWLPSARRCALPNPTSIAGTSRIQASFGSNHRALNSNPYSDSDSDLDLKPDQQSSALNFTQASPCSLSWSVSSESSGFFESPLTTASSTSSFSPQREHILGEVLIESPERASFSSLTSTSIKRKNFSEKSKINHSVQTFNEHSVPSTPIDFPVQGLGISIQNDDNYQEINMSPLTAIQSVPTEATSGTYRDVSKYGLSGKENDRLNPKRRLELGSKSYQAPECKVVIGEELNEEEEPLEFDAAVWPMPPLREVWIEKQSGRKNSLLVTPLDETFEYFPSDGVPLQARERPRRSSF